MINIVLYEPEIPQNTGNIARTCVLTNSKLHLIKPLGFTLEEKHLKRAGLDYWKDLRLEIHESYEDFREFTLASRKDKDARDKKRAKKDESDDW